MVVLDVRSELPTAPWEIGRFGPKLTRTYHWNGPAIPDDVAAMDVILGDAHYHLDKNWGTAANPAYGDGIMYHKLIGPDGTLYITRDADAVLYACGDSWGNESSEHVQVMIGTGEVPTPAQWATMTSLERDEPLQGTHPHSFWSSTTCPGPEITEWVNEERWKEDADMTPDELNRAIDARIAESPDLQNTIEAVKEALKAQHGAIVKLANDETLDDADVATLKERIDKLRTI